MELFCGFIYIMSSVMSCQSGPWVSMAMLLNNTHGDKGVYYLHGALQWQVNFTSPEDNRSSHTPGVLQSKTVEHSGRPRLLAGERSGAAVIRWVEKEMRTEWQNCFIFPFIY